MPWRYIQVDTTDPAFNLALEEYVFESLSKDYNYFILWQNAPTVVIGRHQNTFSEVNEAYIRENNIRVVRRLSGGGAVYHDLGNLNYTIVGRSENLERDYPEYAGIMMKALQSLGVPATLSGRNDILVEGKKVSGFAKRVCKNRLMVHGTLMYKVDVDVLTHVLHPSATKLQSKGVSSVRSRVANLCDYLPEITDIQIFSQRLEEILSCHYADAEYKLSEQDLANIRRLRDEKFATWEWNYGRSPKATLSNSARLACGTVEVHLTLAENRIATCRFGGDFLGNLPASEVEQALHGVVYDQASIHHCLSQMEIGQCFDGIEAEDLVKLMIITG
jgi:lipoate-protein ligase A